MMSPAPSSNNSHINAQECEILQAILKDDDNNNTENLVSLSDIRSYRAWDFSWPTLTKPRRFTPRHTYTSDEAFSSQLKMHNKGKTHSLLSHIGALPKNNNNIVLYGGALVDLILKRDTSIKDWDLRLVGPEYMNNEEMCVNAAKDFVKNVFDWIMKQNEQILLQNINRRGYGVEEEVIDTNAVIVARSKSTITVTIPQTREIKSIILQFTFAPYATIQDLFHHSRPHCTQIAIVNDKVVLSTAARYCLESLCIVLDEKSLTHCYLETTDNVIEKTKNARSLNLEMIRTIRYFDEKGFDIILPNLDIKMVPTRNLDFKVTEVLDLPALTVAFNEIQDNKLMVEFIRLPTSNGMSPTQSNGYDGAINLKSGTSIHHNVRCLVADVYDQFQYVTEGEAVSGIFDFTPTLTPRMVDKVYETVMTNLNSGSISLDEVIQYFSATSPAEVLERVFVYPIRNKCSKLSEQMKSPFRLEESTLKDIIAEERKAILEKLEIVRSKMIEEGMDKLVVNFPEAVSTELEISNALYGRYRLAN